MNPFRWIALGAVWTAAGIAAGAFGAHALHDRLVAADALESWRTAVEYHVWHGLALVLFGLYRSARPGGGFVGWSFAVGSLFFSGSIYALSLDGPGAVLGPITPIGGVALIVVWIGFGVDAWRTGAGRAGFAGGASRHA